MKASPSWTCALRTEIHHDLDPIPDHATQLPDLHGAMAGIAHPRNSDCVFLGRPCRDAVHPSLIRTMERNPNPNNLPVELNRTSLYLGLLFVFVTGVLMSSYFFN